MFHQRLLFGNVRFLFSRCKIKIPICYDCGVVVTWLPCRVIYCKIDRLRILRKTQVDTQDTVLRKSKDVENERRIRIGDHRSQASEKRDDGREGTKGKRAQQRQTGWWSKSENERGMMTCPTRGTKTRNLRRNVAATNIAWRERDSWSLVSFCLYFRRI